MRHGRKSRSGKFNGYKNHILKDADSDIITNVGVSAGNCPDGDMAEPLINEAKEEFGVKTKSLCGDGAYGSGKMRKDMSDKEIELISKTPPVIDTGKLSKEEFDIDVKEERVVCPEGKVAEKCHKSKDAQGEVTKTFAFSKEICSNCPKRNECTHAKNTGRTIRVGPYEEYLQKAREIQKTKKFKEIYNKIRPPVERKISDLIRHGLRKTRYKGKRKSHLQALFTAAGVNLKRIFKEQSEKRLILDIVGANAVSV